MARKLRIQFEGALYHVINRGNYRRDLFETAGAAEAFLTALESATMRYGWRLHAYVLMRNHFHLAVETPSPNLVEGMHWLQSTLATRFNRFRQERGHLFQGRYQSIIVENFVTLARVVDYIHLNPVRAKVVVPEQVGAYRWSSLGKFIKGSQWAGLTAVDWMAVGGWSDDAQGRKAYEQHLISLGKDEAECARRGLVGLSNGWALGTNGWRKALAEDHAHRRLNPGLERQEIRELNEAAWQVALRSALEEQGKTSADLQTNPMNQSWKLQLACKLRAAGAAVGWIATNLNLGKPSSVRSYLSRIKEKNQQTAA